MGEDSDVEIGTARAAGSTRSALLTRRVVVGVFAILLGAWLYDAWLWLPITTARPLGRAYVEGAIGTVLCGSLMALAVHHVADMAVIAGGLMLLGHAAAARRMSDVTMGISGTLETMIHDLRNHDALLVVLLLLAWGGVTTCVRARWRKRAV